ncbi:UNVERIFIED_CONTAM: hypothetical protein FKN15_068653 [Acipenser sinensis]
MKRNGTACQVERFTSSYKAEPNGSVCRTQGNGHPCTNETKSPASTKHRFNRVVPRWSKAADCTGNRCVGSPNGTRTVTALVTGGGGYFGYRLGCALVRCGISVMLLDLHKPKWDIPEGAVFLQLKKAQIESVNVGGTNNVIRVCTQRNITRLIYTSTVNVVFEGSPIEQGDEETVPYVPLDKHVDQYSKTKAIADQMVLAANGTPLKGGMTLRTCVLRPPGIYGPEERRHLQRVAVNIERRLFSFSFGNRHAKMNWVHIDNLVQAHMLAAEALTAGKGYIASGQIYYINDGESVNLFEWLTPLVRNIAVTHTFKIDKARRQLGFCPKQYSFTDSVDYYMESRAEEQSFFSVCLKATLIIGSLLALLFLSCFWDDLSILKTSNETGH